MDLPIRPRSTRDKPRVVKVDGRYYEDRYSLTPRRRPTTWFMCYDEDVAAVGKTIEGAHRNWVSLKIDNNTKEYMNVLKGLFSESNNRWLTPHALQRFPTNRPSS